MANAIRTSPTAKSVLHWFGDSQLSLDLNREALSIRRETLPPGEFMIALLEDENGRALSRAGRIDEAETLPIAGYEGMQRRESEVRTW